MNYNKYNDKGREKVTVKNNAINSKVYSQAALQKLASGTYRRVPELKKTPNPITQSQSQNKAPTVSQNTVSQNTVSGNSAPRQQATQTTTQQRPSTRYNQNVNTQAQKSTRDTRYDKDFDNFFNYRYGDFSGEVDYDPVKDTDVESWRNVKKDIMKKNNWSDKEFEDRFKEYSNERYKKTGNDIIAASVETAKKHPILGTIQQAALNPGVWLEGAANMVSGLPFVSDKYKAQSADDTQFLSSRQKEAIKQTVKDEHIKGDNLLAKAGRGAYDIGTSIADMAMSTAVPVLGTATLGTEAATRTQRQALERGVDPTKAALTGTLAGGISGVMNKVGFDKAAGAEAKTALGKVLKGAGVEGAENVAEDTANLLIDTLMNKDKSQIASLQDYYMSQGMSDKEARAKVTLDTLADLGISGLSGAAFGGAMNGVRNLPELVGDVRAIIPELNNRGAVDPNAMAEQASNAMKAPAKVPRKYEGKMSDEDYNYIFDERNGGVFNTINLARQHAGNTPEAQQLAKDAKKALRNYVESGNADDYYNFLGKIGDLSNLAENAKADYVTKGGREYTYDNLFPEMVEGPTGMRQENLFDRIDNGRIPEIVNNIPRAESAPDNALTPQEVQRLEEGTGKQTIAENIADEIKKKDFKPVTFTDNKGNTYILSKSTREGEKWQLSHVDDTGRFVGHSAYTNDADLLNVINSAESNGGLRDMNASNNILNQPTVTINDMLSNPDAYSLDDFERAYRTFDKNADTDGASKEDLIDALNAQIAEEAGVGNTPVKMQSVPQAEELPPVNEVPTVAPTAPTEAPEIPKVEESIFNKMMNQLPPDEAPRSEKMGQSKVGTNTAVNSLVFTRKQIENDPVIREINSYAKANNDLTFNKAKEDIYSDGAKLLDEYTSGRRKIDSDLDVDRAMILLTDMAYKIKAGDEGLEAQRNLLFSRLREAGTLYGQTIQAFKKWNNTPEGAIANGNSVLHEPVKSWKSNNKKKVELNGRIAKALEQMGVDSSMRNRTKAEKTHEQIKEGVKNVLAREYGSIEGYFNDNDIEFLTTLAEEKKIPVWQITDEIEHKLSTGEWYTLDESTQPKYPVNQRLKNALDELVKQEPTVKEPPTLDEIKNEVRTTLDKEMARTGEFTDDDVDYLSSLIYNGATKEELADALNTKMATGRFGISPETQQQVSDLFAYADRFDPDSKQAFDLKTAAYKLIAEEAVSDDATPFEKFESWRYLAMLGNPKTMVRNYIGNKMFGAVTGVSNNFSAALEAGTDRLSKALGGEGIQRTKTFLNPVDDRALIKAAAEDGEAHRYSELSGSKYEKGTRDAIKQQKSVFNSKLLRLYEAATDRGISDYNAVKKKYSTSLAGYMKANGLDESAFDANDRYIALKDKARSQVLTDAEKAEMDNLKSTVDLLEKARDYAVKQADYATFHEDNAVAKWLTKMSNSAPGPGKAIIEGLVPFKKTPANILKSGFEYSPFGAIKSIKETGKLIYENTGSRKGNLEDTYTKKSKLTGKEKEVNKSLAADVLDSWSKTLTGSGLVVLGYFLKNNGILNSSTDDEKWQDDLEGKQNYSITINGKTYTLDWAAPAVMPLLMGAELSKIKDRNALLDKKWYENMDEILGTVNGILDPFMETSMMQGIQNIVESAANANKYNNDGAKGSVLASLLFNAGLGYMTQGIPTLSGQVARTVDNTRRATDTIRDPYSFSGSLEKQGRKLMNKIPGLSTLNNPYYDSYGRTQNNGPFNNPLGNMAYQMVSPGYLRDINTTAADESARKTYYALGPKDANGKQKPILDSGVFASWKSQVKANGERFTPEEMASYRKTSGEAQYAIRDALAKEEWFNSLDASQQTELLKKVNTLVDKVGKDSVDKLDSSSKDYEAYEAGGVEGLLNKWSGDIYTSKAKDETGLSGSTNAIKEIKAAYAEGDTKKGDELTEKYKKYNEERLRLNEKYGVNIGMADFVNREDANPGGNEAWAKEHSSGASANTTSTSSTTQGTTQVDTSGYEKQIDRAGKQSRKFTNDLPKLKELNAGKSEMYTYAYAINQDSSLTPQKFDTQFKSMDSDKSGSLKQDELINYFNKNNTSQDQAQYLWKTYGENKGTSWKTVPVLKNGVWKKSK